jgi:hypothetical protein
MVLAGIGVLRTARWHGWWRVTPLLCGLYPFLVELPGFIFYGDTYALYYFIAGTWCCWLALCVALWATREQTIGLSVDGEANTTARTGEAFTLIGGGAGVALLVLLVAAGCSGSTKHDTPAARASTERTYVTRSFVVPFAVEVPPGLKVAPSVDEPDFVTWFGTDFGPVIRFLVPVGVILPGSKVASAPPKDYLAYLLGLASAGARFSDETSLIVDGHSATLVTATTNGRVLDGSLGCTDPGSGACFGLESTQVLRIAVIDVGGGRTLVGWGRMSDRRTPAPTGAAASTAQATAFSTFQQFLASIEFR